jgi:D-arabinose 1-dehydrogenase-like Zn-dependent alcohol dehydrogenase
MHAYLGHDERRVPPLILGHEAVGTVLEGSGSGRRVVLNPLITCGVCDKCLGGRQNLCAQRDFIGTYTNTPVDLRATLKKLHSGALGDLGWIEQRPLAAGAQAFDELLQGRCAAPKIVLQTGQATIS